MSDSESEEEEYQFDDESPVKKKRPVKVESEEEGEEEDEGEEEEEEEEEDEPYEEAGGNDEEEENGGIDDDEEEEEEEEDDYEEVKPKKKPKINIKVKKEEATKVKVKKETEKPTKKRKEVPSKVTSSAAGKKKKVKQEEGAGGAPKHELKKLDRMARLQYAMQAFLWWNAKEPPPGCQWVTMEHAGVSFPEPYVPHGVKMLYDGKPVTLTPVEEEAATFYAQVDPNGMNLGNPKTAKIFNKNFFTDFMEVLGKKHIIKDFEKCDFGPIRKHLDDQRLVKKAITDAEKSLRKESREMSIFKYGFAIVDGHLERVGNFNMEPPGAFRGRGEHPKMGKLKSRVAPEQVSLNLSQCAPIPPCIVAGHAWGDVRHDPRGQFLASWKENINNQSKYMQLAAMSSFKGKSDRAKYGKAALLCKNIEKIRNSYKKDLKSKDTETKQLATATWVIDRLALRVGGEKDTEEEADTVGCCSLRVEHLHFDPNGEGGDNKEIELEFLGKDSMLFKQTVDFGAAMYNEGSGGFGNQVFENLQAFCKKKKPTEEVFHSINPLLLNGHLKQFMDGLSAKVFRTYNASKTLQEELLKNETSPLWKNLTAAQKVVEYNNANREVAILCNHQRSVSKAQETQLENIGAKLEMLKKQKKVLKNILKALNNKTTDRIPMRKDIQKMQEDVQKSVEKAKKMKEKAKTTEEKIAATEADEKAKQKKRDLATEKFKSGHLWEKTPTIDQVASRIQAWTAKINKMELDLKHKDDNKEVSLGTSKINYMDPRISVAWCKRNEVPIEKIFSKTLRDKFNWAMAVPPDWEFNETVAE